MKCGKISQNIVRCLMYGKCAAKIENSAANICEMYYGKSAVNFFQLFRFFVLDQSCSNIT